MENEKLFKTCLNCQFCRTFCITSQGWWRPDCSECCSDQNLNLKFYRRWSNIKGEYGPTEECPYFFEYKLLNNSCFKLNCSDDIIDLLEEINKMNRFFISEDKNSIFIFKEADLFNRFCNNDRGCLLYFFEKICYINNIPLKILYKNNKFSCEKIKVNTMTNNFLKKFIEKCENTSEKEDLKDLKENKFQFSVSGVTFDNRQEILVPYLEEFNKTGKRFHVLLVEEEDNKYDKNAIKVMMNGFNGELIHIGYVPKKRDKNDEEDNFNCQVKNILNKITDSCICWIGKKEDKIGVRVLCKTEKNVEI